MIFRMPKLHPKAEVATYPLLEPRLVGSHPPSAPAEGATDFPGTGPPSAV